MHFLLYDSENMQTSMVGKEIFHFFVRKYFRCTKGGCAVTKQGSSCIYIDRCSVDGRCDF